MQFCNAGLEYHSFHKKIASYPSFKNIQIHISLLLTGFYISVLSISLSNFKEEKYHYFINKYTFSGDMTISNIVEIGLSM